MTEYTTLDSGARQHYASGMRRDLQDGKPSFHLLLTPGVPYSAQMLTRWAALMTRGAEKYGPANWTLANSAEELERFRASAIRHLMQWAAGETDEDHAAAVMFNVMAYEMTKWKMEHQEPSDEDPFPYGYVDDGFELWPRCSENCDMQSVRPGAIRHGCEKREAA